MEISDTYGDGRHVSIDVVSPLFEGQSSVKRQRMVYKVRRIRKSNCCISLSAKVGQYARTGSFLYVPTHAA